MKSVILAAALSVAVPAHALFVIDFNQQATVTPGVAKASPGVVAEASALGHGTVLANSATTGMVYGITGTSRTYSLTVENNRPARMNRKGILLPPGPTIATAFDTNRTLTRDRDLEAGTGFTCPETGGCAADDIADDGNPYSITKPGNVLIIQENSRGCDAGTCQRPDDERRGGRLIFDFSDIVTLFGLDLFDVNRRRRNVDPGAVITLEKASGSSVMFTSFRTGGNNTAARLDFGAGIANVIRMTIDLAKEGAIANIRGAVAAPVTEPATLGLIALGLLGAGMAKRRVRQTLSLRVP